MKFVVGKSELFNNLSVVSKVVPSKSTLSVLENVLFHVKGDKLHLIATDGETTINTSLGLLTMDEGELKIAIAHKSILEVLKDMSEQPVEFDINENSLMVTMSLQSSKYSFMGVDGAMFPEVQYENESKGEVVMKADELVSVIGSANNFSAEDELRPVLCGVYFDAKEDGLRVVATNAQQLYMKTIESIKKDTPMSFILPKKTATMLKGILKGSSDVTIGFGERSAKITIGDVLVSCRLVDGRFPNYQAVIPVNNSKKVVVLKNDLLNAVKRVAVFANTATSLVRMDVSENNIKLSAQDIDFSTSANESVKCEYNGEYGNVEIGFKATSLINAISVIDTDCIELLLENANSAGLFKPYKDGEDSDMLILQMPMLLN